MKRLDEIASRCKGSVSLELNPHRLCYQTIREYIANSEENVSDQLIADMEKSGVLVILQFWPNSNVGSHLVYGDNLEEVIDTGVRFLNNVGNKND